MNRSGTAGCRAFCNGKEVENGIGKHHGQHGVGLPAKESMYRETR